MKKLFCLLIVLSAMLLSSCPNPVVPPIIIDDGDNILETGALEFTINIPANIEKKPVLKINTKNFDADSNEILPRKKILSISAWVYIPTSTFLSYNGIKGGQVGRKTAAWAYQGGSWTEYIENQWTEVSKTWATGLDDSAEAVIELYGDSNATALTNVKAYIDDVVITFDDSTSITYNFNSSTIPEDWRLEYGNDSSSGTVTGAQVSTTNRN